MIAVGFDLKSLIQNLAAVETDGQLDTLLLDYSHDCRGLCDDKSQIHTALDLYQAKKIAKILANTCGLRMEEAEAATRSVLLRHPRRESLIRLAEEYTRDAASFAKLERERAKSTARKPEP
jgi:hypothetical protein